MQRKPNIIEWKFYTVWPQAKIAPAAWMRTFFTANLPTYFQIPVMGSALRSLTVRVRARNCLQSFAARCSACSVCRARPDPAGSPASPCLPEKECKMRLSSFPPDSSKVTTTSVPFRSFSGEAHRGISAPTRRRPGRWCRARRGSCSECKANRQPDLSSHPDEEIIGLAGVDRGSRDRTTSPAPRGS